MKHNLVRANQCGVLLLGSEKSFINCFAYDCGTILDIICKSQSDLQLLRLLSGFAMIHRKLCFFLNAFGRF